MSGACRAKQAGIAVSLVVVWAAAAYGAVKPRDPNSVAAPVKATAPQATQSPKPGAKAQPERGTLENPATFTPDMPFGRAIEILRHCVYPPINIVVLWRDVEEKAGITRETPIGLDGVPGLRIRQYIELLLRSVSAGTGTELSYVLDGGVILIATKESLPKPKIETHVYDISDLAAPPSTGMMFMPMMGMMSPFGVGGPMQSYGNYGTGMPYNGYGPSAGYNSAGNQPRSLTNNQRPSSGPVMVVR